MGKLDNAELRTGRAKEELQKLLSKSVQSVITSPPYFGLRDYHADGQIGLEESLEDYIQNLADIFDEVHRILHPKGTLWLNLGDSYSGSGGPGGDFRDGKGGDTYKRQYDRSPLKKKDLCMVPSRVAMELQQRGWWIRSEIVWAKAVSFCDGYTGTCMPQSAEDRPTNSHEKLFLLSKSKDYFYDEEAVAQPIADQSRIGEVRGNSGHSARGEERVNQINPGQGVMKPTKKLRDVWTFNPASFSSEGTEHFATFPLGLIEPCVKAGSPEKGVCLECGAPFERKTEVVDRKIAGGSRSIPEESRGAYKDRQGQSQHDRNGLTQSKTKTKGWKPTCDCDAEPKPATVLDPFSGAATTGIATLKHGRKYIGIDVNENYNELAKERIRDHKEVPADHSFW